MKTHSSSLVKILKAASVLAVMSSAFATISTASPLVFEGQNAGLFPGANPAAIGILTNSLVKPQNTGATVSGNQFSTEKAEGSLLAQSIFAQQQTEINNQIFNCGTNCQPTFSINLGGGYAETRYAQLCQ